MFVKIYTYHVLQKNEKELMDVLTHAEDIYSKYITKQSFILKSRDNSTKWMEIHRYQDKKTYDESIEVINRHPEIKQLYSRFLELVDSIEELADEDFQEITRSGE